MTNIIIIHSILIVFSQYVKLVSVEDYSCVTSFYLDSRFSFTHLHIFQIFINNLNLLPCCVQVVKLGTFNLKYQIYTFLVVKAVK